MKETRNYEDKGQAIVRSGLPFTGGGSPYLGGVKVVLFALRGEIWNVWMCENVEGEALNGNIKLQSTLRCAIQEQIVRGSDLNKTTNKYES